MDCADSFWTVHGCIDKCVLLIVDISLHHLLAFTTFLACCCWEAQFKQIACCCWQFRHHPFVVKLSFVKLNVAFIWSVQEPSSFLLLHADTSWMLAVWWLTQSVIEVSCHCCDSCGSGSSKLQPTSSLPTVAICHLHWIKVSLHKFTKNMDICMSELERFCGEIFSFCCTKRQISLAAFWLVCQPQFFFDKIDVDRAPKNCWSFHPTALCQTGRNSVHHNTSDGWGYGRLWCSAAVEACLSVGDTTPRRFCLLRRFALRRDDLESSL